jgi:autotransporter-associated beta strand protein
MLFIGTFGIPGGMIGDETVATGTSSGLSIVGAGTVVLTQEDTYAGTTYVKSGTLQIQDPNALGGAAVNGAVQNEIQRLTIVDPSYDSVANTSNGQFTLSYNGGPASPLLSSIIPPESTPPGSGGATASLQNALMTLLGVTTNDIDVSLEKIKAPVAGSTAQAPSLTEFVYTIVFKGTLAGMDLPQLVAQTIGGCTVTPSTAADGGVGARVEDGGTLALDLVNAASQNVVGVALQLNGDGAGGKGALRTVSGDAVWQGPTNSLTPKIPAITLSSSAAIGVDAGTTLTILPDASGTSAIAGLTPAALSKVGPGTLFLTTPTNYQGDTLIKNGIVNISDPNALGAPNSNEVQTVTINGSTNGTFELSIDGTNFTTSVSADYTNPATLSQLQGALDQLLGAGNTKVTQAANAYTITFIGALSGQRVRLFEQNTAGTTITLTEVIQGGLGGTYVMSSNGVSGTLQLAGGITYSSGEVLNLNGPGFDAGSGPIGALDSIPGASAANTWDNPIVLGGNASIGVEFDPSGSAPGLIVDQTISQAGTNRQLTKVGLGSLEITGANDDTYNGLTTVANGTLLLDKPTGFKTIPAALTVGVPGSIDLATARLLADGQLNAASTVTVNSNGGLFDVNNFTTSVGKLAINDGTAQTGDTGTLSATALVMTGGVLNTNAGGKFNLSGNVTATSDTDTGAATITGTGTFSISGVRTFTVNHQQPGPTPPPGYDLNVKLPITASAIIKSGDGRMRLGADNTTTLPGTSTVTAGELAVDGALNDVVLNGGTVAGLGSIGNILGPNGAPPQGAINPGENGDIINSGVLTSNPSGATEVWGPATQFLVDLNNLSNSHPMPNPGADFDQFIINGDLNLGGFGQGAKNGGATLNGTVGAGVNVGDQFTVIQTADPTEQIIGRFAEPNGEDASGNGIAFINGIKFLVLYSPTTVVLQRVLMSATLGISSDLTNDTSVYGQNAVFTATMVAENGAGKIPSSDTVTFTLDATSANPSGTVSVTEHLDANGQAAFDPQSLVPFTETVGTHTVKVTFNTDPNFATVPPATLTWTINKDDTNIDLEPAGPTTAVYGEVVPVTATLTAAAPGGETTGAKVPSSPANVVFTIDAGTPDQTTQSAALVAGVASINVSGLSLGTHTVKASYGGDADYNGVSTVGTIEIDVVQDNATVTILANPTSPTLVGQSTTFTARITTDAPGTATPKSIDTVTFYDGTTKLGSDNVVFNSATGFYEAQIDAGQLAVGTHQITADFSGDDLINPSSGQISYVVNRVPTTISVGSSVNPSILGQQVLFTATINAASSAGTITGIVNFYDFFGTTSQTLLGSANVSSAGQALLTVSDLFQGTHDISVVYLGNTNYSGSSSTTLTQVVLYGDTVTVDSSLNPATYGDTETFTATVHPVTGTPGQAGTPAGTVDFYDGTKLLKANVSLDGSGEAAFTTTTPLSIGTHTIIAYYHSTNSYITANGSVDQVIRSATTSTLSTSVNPSGLGLDVTFTATVQPVSPGTGVPDGTVTFFDGTTVLGTGDLDKTTGEATFTTNALGLGTHSITASYPGSATYAPSATSAISQIVRYADTTTISSSLNPAPVGGGVTFTATVVAAPNTPAGIRPTGSVTFFDGTTNLGTSNLNTSSQATLTTSSLGAGTHSITAVYNGTTTFVTTTSAPLSQSVLDTTKTTISTSKTPTRYSEALTFTATVVPNKAGNPTPTGTVDFFDGGNNLLGSATLNGSGQATFTPKTPLSVGTHAITAVYETSAKYFASTSAAVSQVILQAGTATTVSSAKTTTVYSEPPKFTATVTPTSPATAIPTGTVAFFAANTQIGTATLDSKGVAVFSPTTPLPVGNHFITARYVASTNFAASTSPQITQSVIAANSVTTVSSSVAKPVYGQTLTFTATVGPLSPALATPGGSVTFRDTYNGVTTTLGTGTLDANGQATISTSTPLKPGTHTISATYGATPQFNSSVGKRDVTVGPASTAVTLKLLNSPAVFGEPLQFEADVTSPFATPTGSVSFFDTVGGVTTNLGGGSVDASGTIIFTPAKPLPVGTYQITATFNANSRFDTSTSTAQTQTVTADNTQVTVSSSSPLVNGVPTSVYSEAAVFTATVTPASPGTATPSGTVDFFADGTKIGTATLDASGHASIVPQTPLNVGTHSITAVFEQTSDFNGSTSAAITQAITQASTSTSVTGAPNPAVYSQPVTLKAIVTPTAPATKIPDGSTVSFFDGTAFIGAGTTSFVAANHDFEATLTVPAFPVGAHQITARLETTTNFTGSTSSVFTETVNTAPTTATLTSSSTATGTGTYESTFGNAVTFTVSVSAAPGVGTPAGIVTFKDGATILFATTLDATTSTAQFTTSTLAVGTHVITAAFTGSAPNYASSSASVTQTVDRADSITTVTASANPTVVGGAAITVTATITPTGSGTGVPSGTVDFVDATTGAVLASGVIVVNGVATTQVAGLSFGTHDLRATYSGNGNFNGSVGDLSETVLYATSTFINSSLNPGFPGQPVQLTATVQPGPGAPTGTPTGSVTFYNGTTPIGTANLSGGQASITTTSLPTGANAITAVYSGDGVTYGPSTSGVLTESIFQLPASIRAHVVGTHAIRAHTRFAVVARLYDGNGRLITNYGGPATLVQVSGTDGAFNSVTVTFKNGRFVFRGLRLHRNGKVVLEVTIPTPSGDMASNPITVNGIGRLT